MLVFDRHLFDFLVLLGFSFIFNPMFNLLVVGDLRSSRACRLKTEQALINPLHQKENRKSTPCSR